jgi:hypothetical protein
MWVFLQPQGVLMTKLRLVPFVLLATISLTLPLVTVPTGAQEIPGPPIVTPNSGSKTNYEGQTGLSATFWIESQSSFSENFSLSCSRTGEVASCSVQSSITIGAWQTQSVAVT